MTRGKQSVKKGIWYSGKKKKNKNKNKKRQQGKGFPIGLIASATAPLLGEIARPIFKTIFGRGRRKDNERKNTAAETCFSKERYITKWANLLREVRKNEQTKFTAQRYNKKK